MIAIDSASLAEGLQYLLLEMLVMRKALLPRFKFGALIFSLAIIPNFCSADCGPVIFSRLELKDGITKLMASTEGPHPTIFYRSDLDINTDGTAKSYHPDDPDGVRIAINNIVNAITTAWDKNGQKLTCDQGDSSKRQGACYKAYIKAFKGAREANYSPTQFPRIETTDIIPWRRDHVLGHDTPCLNSQGFFVSQTSLALNANLPICDQERYVDGLSVNAVVYPANSLSAQGVVSDKGDLVVVRDRDTGNFAFSLNGDENPSRIGEGTPSLAAALLGKVLRPDGSRPNIQALKRSNVDYLVFAKDDVERYWRNRGGTTQSRIDRFGQEVFEDWGGVKRFEECSNAYDLVKVR